MRYLVKLAARTPLAPQALQQFKLTDATVFVSSWTETDAGGAHPIGLFFDVQLDALDAASAVASAQNASTWILNLLCFVAATGHMRVEPLVTYEDKGEDVRAYQVTETPIVSIARRNLDAEGVQVLWDRINSLPVDGHDRLFRALAWFAKAADERVHLDRFVSAWSGLETINPSLQDKYGLPRSTTPLCKTCGAELPSAFSTSGITKALELAERGDLARIARRKRVALLHGTDSVAVLMDGMEELSNALVQALRAGIRALLDVADEEWKAFGRSAMMRSRPPRMHPDYDIVGMSLDQVPPGEAYPHLAVADLGVLRERVDGVTKQTVTPRFEHRHFTQLTREFRFGVEADRDPDDPGATVEITRVAVLPHDPETLDNSAEQSSDRTE